MLGQVDDRVLIGGGRQSKKAAAGGSVSRDGVGRLGLQFRLLFARDETERQHPGCQ
jgi:hypothetical protein